MESHAALGEEGVGGSESLGGRAEGKNNRSKRCKGNPEEWRAVASRRTAGLSCRA